MALKFPVGSQEGGKSIALRLRSSFARVSRYVPMTPTPNATVVDLRGDCSNGQQLAGSGALVFEGELLERPPRYFH
jgi:hypothetical protein